VVRALAILFAAVVGRGASVFGFSFVCGTMPDCAAGPGVEASFLALGSAFILSQIGGGLLFLYGFAKLRAVRLEFGADHARNVERARVFLSLTVVLLLAGFFAPFLLNSDLASRNPGARAHFLRPGGSDPLFGCRSVRWDDPAQYPPSVLDTARPTGSWDGPHAGRRGRGRRRFLRLSRLWRAASVDGLTAACPESPEHGNRRGLSASIPARMPANRPEV